MAKKVKTSVKNNQLLKTYVTKINAEMAALAEEMQKLSDNLNKMMKGDANGPYWNGEDAAAFYYMARKNVSNNIIDYSTARDKLDYLGELYELVHGGYKK